MPLRRHGTMFREFPASPQTCLRRCTRLTITCLGNARCGTSKTTALSITVTRVTHQGFAWCSTVQMPFVRDRKWKKKWVLSERSEFRPLPIFCPAQTGTPKGQRRRGRLSLLTFFGEAKKVSSRPATPGNAPLHEERTASTSKPHKPYKQ